MIAVAAIALLFALARFARRDVPHFLRCRTLSLQADTESRMCREMAALFRNCALRSSSTPTIYYCHDPFLEHFPPAEDVREHVVDEDRLVATSRERIAKEHRRAAEDHEHAAEIFAARARRCWRAAFRPWEPTPVWTEAEINTYDVLTRYRSGSTY